MGQSRFPYKFCQTGRLRLGTVESARVADLNKVIGVHGNRETCVHVRDSFPSGLVTFAVYSFKGVKSTVIFYKITGRESGGPCRETGK